MGRFPIADKALVSVWICRKCKARNAKNAPKCRKCDYTNLRPKRARKKGAAKGA
jgi:large subunit ribosomal protein L40e